MELCILDQDFQEQGIVDVFSCLLWNRRYYETGDFELHTIPEHFALLQEGSYLYRPDTQECALLETIVCRLDSSGGKDIIASGRFLEQLLYDRVIDQTQKLSGTGEEVMRALIETVAIAPADTKRIVNRLQLGSISGVGEPMQQQVTGKNLLEALQEIGRSQQIAVSLRYNYLQDQILATIWQGKDRTEGQKENSWATFSTQYENILASEFSDSIAEERNFAYVAGEGEGSQRVIVTVDQTDGAPRRELYVDARDLQKENQTQAQYEETLRQRGIEKLAEYQRHTTLDGDIDIHTNLNYRKDFDLGDLCTYVDHSLGIEVEQRITEISEVYEGGRVEVTATFGDQQWTILQKIRREGR